MQKDDSNEPSPPSGKDILLEGTRGVQPGKNDVLMGRGKKTFSHEGNVHFRKLVHEQVPAYLANEKNKKVRKALARGIVDRIAEDGGAFLRQARRDGDDIWEPTPQHIVVAKVKQALRDMASAMVFPLNPKQRTSTKASTAISDSKGAAAGRPSTAQSATTERLLGQSLLSTQPFAAATNPAISHQVTMNTQAQLARQAQAACQPNGSFIQQQLLQAQLLLALNANTPQQTPAQQLAQHSTRDLATALDTQRWLQILSQGANGLVPQQGISPIVPLDGRLPLYQPMQNPYNQQALPSASLLNFNTGAMPSAGNTNPTQLVEAEIRRLLLSSAATNPQLAHLTANAPPTGNNQFEARAIESFLQNNLGQVNAATPRSPSANSSGDSSDGSESEVSS